MANPKTGCNCGSGAHPRECPIHPELYRLHVASLNLDAYLPEEGEDADPAFKASMELELATQEALRIAKIPPTKCAYSHIPLDPSDPEDRPFACVQIANFTCCDFGGPVCFEHRCRCSRPLTPEQRLALARDHEWPV